MRLPRYVEPLFAEAFLETLDVELAATKIGIIHSPRHFGNALMKRPTVKALVDKLKAERCERLRMDADQVLAELTDQYARLKAMLGWDIATLYDGNGQLLPIAEWPEMWRKRLVTEIETKEAAAISPEAPPAIVTKLKRETTLGIERQIRETLEAIGEHVNVAAYGKNAAVQPSPVQITIVHVGGSEPSALPAPKQVSGQVIDIQVGSVTD